MVKFTVFAMNTTDGKRYIILNNGKVMPKNTTYFKLKSTAQKRADSMNKKWKENK